MHYIKYAIILAAGSNILPVHGINFGAAIGMVLSGKSRRLPTVRPSRPRRASPKKIERVKPRPPPIVKAPSPVVPAPDDSADDEKRATAIVKALQKQNLGVMSNSQAPQYININVGDRNYGGNDISQTSLGGSSVRDGGKIDTNTQVDKSMNDNRVQVGNGATVSGNTLSNSRTGAKKKTKRNLPLADYNLNEDGAVVYRDFLLLIHAMKSSEQAKSQMLYEIASVPTLRSLVENLISTYTTTDGQLTMDNFEALVESMTADKRVERAVVEVFNGNMLYAYLVEKLLTQYYRPQGGAGPALEEDGGEEGEGEEVERRGVVDVSQRAAQRWELNARALYRRGDEDDEFLWLDARDVYEDYSSLGTRDGEREVYFGLNLYY